MNYLVPRSIALERAPVLRPRWNFKSRECRWRNEFLAIVLTESWATLAKMALRNSLNNAAPALATPSSNDRYTIKLVKKYFRYIWVMKTKTLKYFDGCGTSY